MKHLPRACTAGVVAFALAGGVVGIAASGSASAATEPVAAPLAAPASLSPDDTGAAYPHQVRKNVTLDWAPVSGATGYRVEVGTDDTWSDTPVLTQDVLSSRFTLPVSLPHATYVWRVAALKGTAVGQWSSESGLPQTDAEFTRGWRDVPTPTQVVSPFEGRPTYAWSPVAEASGYELQVSSNPSFGATSPATASTVSPDTTASPQTETQANFVLTSCLTPRTRVTPYQDRAGADGSVGECKFVAPTAGSTMYWRVRALDAFVGAPVKGETTSVASGGVSSAPPATDDTETDVTSGCPADPATASASPSATASASPSASASAAPAGAVGCTPAAPSEAGSWSPISTFVYAVVDHSGETYNPSAVVPTTSVATDPDGVCPTVSNPDGTAEKGVCSDFPSISWAHAPGATRYRVYVGLDDQFSNISSIVETSGLQWTPAQSWRDSSPSTSFYYAVQPCTASGCGAVTTTPPSVRKATARLALGTKPGVTGDITLSWQSYAAALAAQSGKGATQDAVSYRVQVAKSDHPSYDVVVDDVTVDGSSYTPFAKAYGDDSFVWRVQPIDSSGNKLPFSLSQSFTRDATPPKVLSASPSSRVGVLQAVKLVFSEPVTGLSSSTVTLSPAAATTLSVTGSTTATLIPSRPFLPGAKYTVIVSSAVKDLSGNSAVASGPAFTINPLADNGNRAITYGSSWRILASSNAVGGTFHASTPTSTAKTTATMVFRGTGVALTACMGPSNGLVDVFVDGVRKSRLSTYRSFSGCGVRIAAIGGLARTQHTVKIVGIGARVSASKGNTVALDALTVTP